jgi:K+-transporting ATPase ATPase C chain
MRRQLLPALVMLMVFTVLTGVVYPLAVTGVTQVLFPGEARGSIIDLDGRPVGSKLIGQPFTQPGYFHPRPSFAGDGYDASASGASNQGPTNPEFLAEVERRAVAYRQENGLSPETLVPVDAVTASGSGLDPHISRANAEIQAHRVAAARDLTVAEVLAVVDVHTESRTFGFMGEPGVNVLELNLALDSLVSGPSR